MAIPTYDRFIEPILRYLAAHPEGAAANEVHEAAADALRVSPDERLSLLPSGQQPIYKNRSGWAHDRLKRAGYSTSVKRGVWRLTEAGVAFAKKHPKPLSDEELDAIASAGKGAHLGKGGELAESPASSSVDDGSPKESPDERIGHALAELRESVSRELLELIGRAPPSFFERLVLELLHAMGYGATRADLQQVGGSSDGGIDGTISLDRLGLEKVYVQAKRWKGTVGSPQVRDFMGALQLQGADKGVMLTTSAFAREAREAAARARGTIVLVDGRQLAALMIDHGVGVTATTLKVPKIDSDYFEEG